MSQHSELAFRHPITPLTWRPTSWSDLVGCPELKQACFNFVYNIRCRGLLSGQNMLVSGKSRSGKTCHIQFMMRSLTCFNLNLQTLNPCDGTCGNCRSRVDVYGNRDWEDLASFIEAQESVKTPIRLHFGSFDCANPDFNELKDRIREAHAGHLVTIIHLEETHWLAKHNHDQRLLKLMDDYPINWIGTSAFIEESELPKGEKELNKPFQNRFGCKLTTEAPSELEMMEWLGKRCREFGIKVAGVPKSTLGLLCQQSHYIPGFALMCLSKVFLDREHLTIEGIKEFRFHFDD